MWDYFGQKAGRAPTIQLDHPEGSVLSVDILADQETFCSR